MDFSLRFSLGGEASRHCLSRWSCCGEWLTCFFCLPLLMSYSSSSLEGFVLNDLLLAWKVGPLHFVVYVPLWHEPDFHLMSSSFVTGAKPMWWGSLRGCQSPEANSGCTLGARLSVQSALHNFFTGLNHFSLQNPNFDLPTPKFVSKGCLQVHILKRAFKNTSNMKSNTVST